MTRTQGDVKDEERCFCITPRASPFPNFNSGFSSSLQERLVVERDPGGYSGINKTGGGGGGSTEPKFCTQKNTWTLYCAPKKIQDWKYAAAWKFGTPATCRLFESCFRFLRKFWLELRKNY